MLKNTNEKIEIIYHFADIHIRNNNERHNEYREVFERVYSKLEQEKKKFITVVCGDILHDKTILKPDAIELTKEFFHGLSKYSDVLVILGNHDCNINNKKSMDSLTPIIGKMFQTEHNIYLLRESGKYEYNNIIFGVTSIYEKEVTKIGLSDKIKIGLYHGTIKGSKYDMEMTTNNGLFVIKDFKEYDYVMLGDIHKHQYLNTKKTIAYSGSLIQQNYGEELKEHGFIRWDLENKSSKLIKISNDYGYEIIKITNKEDLEKVMTRVKSKKPRIRLDYSVELLTTELDKFDKNMQTNFKEIEINRNELISVNGIEMNLENGAQIEINKASTGKDLLGIIKKYLESIKIEKKIIKQTENYLSTILQDKTQKQTNQVEFNILELEFSNLFSYGENNKINFTNMKNIVGLVAENGAGKSSLIDAILFSIYGKFSRGIGFDAVNINKRTASSKITFQVNNIKYIIERQLDLKSKTKNNYRHYLQYYKNGENHSQDKKQETEILICKDLWTFEEFINSSICLQNGNNFLDMRSLDIKDTILKMCNYNIIDEMIREIKSNLIRVTRNLSCAEKMLKEKDSEEIVENTKIKLELLLKEIKNDWNKLLVEQDESKTKLIKAEMLMSDLNIKWEDLENLDITTKIIEKCYYEIHKLSKNINNNKKYITRFKSDIKQQDCDQEMNKIILKQECIEAEYINCDHLLEQLDESVNKIKMLHEKKEKLNMNLDILKKSENQRLLLEYEKIKQNTILSKENIQKMESNISYYTKLADNYKEHEYNKNCIICMKNQNTKDKLFYNKMIKKITQENESEKKKVIQNLSLIEKYENNNIIKIEQNVTEIEQAILLINKEIQIIKLNKIKLQTKLVEIYKNNNKYTRYKQNQNNNKIIEEKIIFLKIKENIKNNVLRKIQQNQEFEYQIKELCDRINKLKNQENKIQELKQINFNKLKQKINTIQCKIQEYQELEYEYTKKIIEIKQEITQIKQCQSEIIKYKNEKDLIKKIFELLSEGNNDGFLEFLLNKQVLNVITKNVNSILNHICNFNIVLSYTKKGVYIHKKLNNKLLPSSALCGFEKFVVNIALKIVFSQINNKIKTDFFIIDEGFSCCDSENLKKLTRLFNYLRSKYKWCFIISHIEQIKNMFDKSIIINKTIEGSHIEI